jgi:hypothetical protein
MTPKKTEAEAPDNTVAIHPVDTIRLSSTLKSTGDEKGDEEKATTVTGVRAKGRLGRILSIVGGAGSKRLQLTRPADARLFAGVKVVRASDSDGESGNSRQAGLRSGTMTVDGYTSSAGTVESATTCTDQIAGLAANDYLFDGFGDQATFSVHHRLGRKPTGWKIAKYTAGQPRLTEVSSDASRVEYRSTQAGIVDLKFW